MRFTKDEKAFLEELAAAMQEGGLPRSGGRLLAYLIICTPGEASFEEIMADLKMSKGSVSQTLSLLQGAGFVEMVKEEGVRKRHYRLCNPAHENFIEGRIQGIRKTQALFQKAKSLNAAAGRKAQRPVLDDIIRFNGFMAKELAEIKKKWKDQ